MLATRDIIVQLSRADPFLFHFTPRMQCNTFLKETIKSRAPTFSWPGRRLYQILIPIICNVHFSLKKPALLNGMKIKDHLPFVFPNNAGLS